MSPRVRAGLVLLFAFAAGVVTGMVIERHYFVSPQTSTHAGAGDHAAAIAEMQDVLQLDDAQVARVHEILQERQRVVHEMWQTLRPEIQREMQAVHLEIAELLTAEQRARYHHWIQELEPRHGPRSITIQER